MKTEQLIVSDSPRNAYLRERALQSRDSCQRSRGDSSKKRPKGLPFHERKAPLLADEDFDGGEDSAPAYFLTVSGVELELDDLVVQDSVRPTPENDNLWLDMHGNPRFEGDAFVHEDLKLLDPDSKLLLSFDPNEHYATFSQE